MTPFAPAVNPYNHQLHVYDKEPAGKPRFPASFPRPARRVSRHHRRLAEVGEAQVGLQIVADYTSGGDKMHMCYAFEFLANEKLYGGSRSQGHDRFQSPWRPGDGPAGRSPTMTSSATASRWGGTVHDRDHYLRTAGRPYHVAARLHLPLPGRGTGTDRSRPCFRGSAGIPTASSSGRTSRAVTAAAPPWSWSEHEQSAGFTIGQPVAAGPARTPPPCGPMRQGPCPGLDAQSLPPHAGLQAGPPAAVEGQPRVLRDRRPGPCSNDPPQKRAMRISSAPST